VREVNAVEAERYACDSIANGVSWADQLLSSEFGAALCRKGAQERAGLCHRRWIPHSEQSPAIEKRVDLVSSEGELELESELEMPKVEMCPKLICYLARDLELYTDGRLQRKEEALGPAVCGGADPIQ
jgi:hypothetical protein